MTMTCMKCGHVAQSADANDSGAACPQCGAIYSKVQAALEAKASIKRVTERPRADQRERPAVEAHHWRHSRAVRPLLLSVAVL